MHSIFQSGSAIVNAGLTELTVNYALPFVPSRIFVTLRQPSDNSELISAYVIGQFSATQFTVAFSSAIPKDGYFLDWTAYAEDKHVDHSGTLAVGYPQLRNIVRRFLGYNEQMTEEQSDEVDEYIQSGLRQFYYPPATEAHPESYEWSFLHGGASIVTTKGVQSVTVPNSVGRVRGQLNCIDLGNRNPPILIVGEAEIDARASRSNFAQGVPIMACLRHKPTFGASGQAKELSFFPIPDDNYTYAFQLESDPAPLSESNPLPLGGMKHSELLTESCLAIAEQRANDEIGIHTERFKALLETAIKHDRMMGAEWFGPMSGPEGMHGVSSVELPRRMTLTYRGNTI